MKYIVVVGDGMADYPMESLGGKTPLEAARTPNMDRVAREGSGGKLKTVPGGFPPSSDVANLALLGYNPSKYYTGRGPLEAVSMEVKIEDDELAFRCNLVTVSDGRLIDYSAGHISSDEGRVLIDLLEEKLGGRGIKFHPGVGYRHLLVVKEALLEDGKGGLKTTPPHDFTGSEFQPYLPRGRGADFLNRLIRQSVELLADHEINAIRVDLGENPANMIWLWGEGKSLRLPSFEKKYNLRGSLISAVDLLKGIALAGGLKVVDVPGATGYFDTDYSAKGRAALEALSDRDFVYVHIEAPDEAGHLGRVMEKIKAIEAIDEKIVGPLLESGSKSGELRLAVLTDHATPISLRTHTGDPVPFAVWGPGIEPDRMEAYSEGAARKGGLRQRVGHKFLNLFFKAAI